MVEIDEVELVRIDAYNLLQVLQSFLDKYLSFLEISKNYESALFVINNVKKDFNDLDYKVKLFLEKSNKIIKNSEIKSLFEKSEKIILKCLDQNKLDEFVQTAKIDLNSYLEDEKKYKSDYSNIYRGRITILYQFISDNVSIAISMINYIYGILLAFDLGYQAKLSKNITVENIYELMNLHSKIKDVSEQLFKNKHYRNSILDSFIKVEESVKEKSGIRNKTGWDLMTNVFDENNPILKLKNSDKDEQRGFKFLFAASQHGIRNTKAHSIIEQKDPYKTLEYLALASLLMKCLDETERVNNEN